MARLGVAALPLALAGACGGETGGGGSRLSTGLPPDLVLNEASASEQAQFCESLARFIVGAADETCVVSGILFSSDAEECRADVADCRRELSSPQTLDELSVDCEIKAADSSCRARVADAERCYSASLALLKRVSSTLSCTSDPQEARDTLDAAEARLSECDLFQEQCPSLYEGDSGSGSGDCCDPNDPCDWANDGVCDCGGTTAWDGNDCSTPAGGPCCAADDPCLLGNDAWCDCPDQAWDTADCRG